MRPHQLLCIPTMRHNCSQSVEVTAISSIMQQLRPFRPIRSLCLHHDTDQVPTAFSPTKKNLASTQIDWKFGAPPKTSVQTRLALVAVCDAVLVPRLPEPATPFLTMKLYVPAIILAALSSSTEDASPAPTLLLIMNTGAFATQTFKIKRPRR